MSSDIRFEEKIWDLNIEVRSLWRQIDILKDSVYELEKKLREKEKEDGER